MSKPTDAVERAKAKEIAWYELNKNRRVRRTFVSGFNEGFDAGYAAEVERELAAYRERLRAKVELLECFPDAEPMTLQDARFIADTGYGRAKADVLELIDGE